MTNEERQKLIAFIVDLRALGHDDKADLLERLAEENRLLERRLKGLESEIVCMSYDLVR
jgi:GTPase involved in cell partitioning and DNA repair